jgi:hypothetical protein
MPRAAYGALVEHVRENVSINKPTVDPVHQVWFRELMKRAACYTSWAAVDIFNNRQPLELQTRPYVEERVEELVRNFDQGVLTPAVVVIQDAYQEGRQEWNDDDIAAAMAIKKKWVDGRARALFRAVEGTEGAPRVHAFTLVGNHSTEACSRLGVNRRSAYVFFRSALNDDDFMFISRAENDMTRAAAATTALYTDYRRPLRLVPFLRAVWARHGRPQFRGYNQERYNAYLRNLTAVLEHEPATVKKGSATPAWLQEAEALKATLTSKLRAAAQLQGGQRMEELQKVCRRLFTVAMSVGASLF